MMNRFTVPIIAAALMFGQSLTAQTVVESSPAKPYTFSFKMVLPATTVPKISEGNIQEVPIPSGTRLIVEFITLSTVLPTNTGIGATLTSFADANAVANGSTASSIHNLTLIPEPASSGESIWSCTSPVKIYSDGSPEFTINIASLVNEPLVGGTILVSISGYLVPQT
jgi:hypothetical protein